jgi:hypothetical protein
MSGRAFGVMRELFLSARTGLFVAVSFFLMVLAGMRIAMGSLRDTPRGIAMPPQKLMFMPMSTLRGFWTPVGFMKNGDVITPLKPVRFA